MNSIFNLVKNFKFIFLLRSEGIRGNFSRIKSQKRAFLSKKFRNAWKKFNIELPPRQPDSGNNSGTCVILNRSHDMP